jgi:hypothetical protein
MNHKIFYLHIPKCAGSSINHLLGQVSELRNKICKVYDVPSYVNKVETIRNGNIIIGHFGTNFYSDFSGKKICMTMLRDPIDRILSHYSYWKINTFDSIGCDEAQRFNLSDFLRCELPNIKFQLENVQAWMLISDYRRESRQAYLNFSRKELADIAIERLLQLDYVGTTKNYDRDIVEILNLMGVSEQQQTKLVYPKEKINMTKCRLELKDLTDKDLELLYEFTDIDTILYKKALTLHCD